MADWDPPFPVRRRRVRPKDEEYWDEHRATPKAFVSLATGRRLWGSRFGQTTSIRVAPAPGMTLEDLRSGVWRSTRPRWASSSSRSGSRDWPPRPGTTPFNVLFLGFSSFIIAAAVMLVALLFRLGIERRASEVGILLAVGFRRRQVGRLLAGEGLVVAAAGKPAGRRGGGRLCGADAAGPADLVAGRRGHAVPAAVRHARQPGHRLRQRPGDCRRGDRLVGPAVRPHCPAAAAGRRTYSITLRVMPRSGRAIATLHSSLVDLAMLLAAVAPAVVLLAAPLGEDAQAGAFFGAGALVLACLLLRGLAGVCGAGRRGRPWPRDAATSLRMALRNAARNPGRSTLSIGLVASACFLIVAVERLPPRSGAAGAHARQRQRRLRPGGRERSADLPRPGHAGGPRRNWASRRKTSGCWPSATIIALRVKPGDDASCLNLYQPRQPRLLGVPAAAHRPRRLRLGRRAADERTLASCGRIRWPLSNAELADRRQTAVRAGARDPRQEHGQLLAAPLERSRRDLRR